MYFNPLYNHRILIIDDFVSTHDLFRKILAKPSNPDNPEDRDSKKPTFEVTSASNGEDGLFLIEDALREGRPYAMAFVDVRMAPGWDGVQTVCKIWEKYPDLQVVMCTAYADYSWEEMVKPMGDLDRLVILHKPFDRSEVLQLAVSMTEKWRLNQQAKLRVNNLEQLVKSGLRKA
jgi:DNA-binding NtrC family response regulator